MQYSPTLHHQGLTTAFFSVIFNHPYNCTPHFCDLGRILLDFVYYRHALQFFHLLFCSLVLYLYIGHFCINSNVLSRLILQCLICYLDKPFWHFRYDLEMGVLSLPLHYGEAVLLKYITLQSLNLRIISSTYSLPFFSVHLVWQHCLAG